jgi:hypothetical protein
MRGRSFRNLDVGMRPIGTAAKPLRGSSEPARRGPRLNRDANTKRGRPKGGLSSYSVGMTGFEPATP